MRAAPVLLASIPDERRSRAASFVLALAAAAGLLAGCTAVAPAGADVVASAEAAPSDCLGTLAGVDLHAATILDLQRALAAGEITSVALVDAYVARIQAYDEAGPTLNSVQAVSPLARDRAAALDAERAAGLVRGPLHGIPVLLKDNIGTVDLPTTAGSIALATNVPKEAATLTTRLEEAGAIVLGKTQLSEFANWVSLRMPNGYSSLGGQVVNAYTMGDPSGSSSGSGVAGSMAFAAITVGTETSGSILSPSNANSLVGVKPTTGLVSRAGVIPLAGSFDTPGPMGRHVEDAALLLDGMAGPDEKDARTLASEGRVPPGGYAAGLSTEALRGARIGYTLRGESTLLTTALAALRAEGAVLVQVDSRNLDRASLAEIGLIPNEFKAQLNAYLANEAGPGLPVKDLTGVILYNQQHPDKVKYGQDLLLASNAQPGLQPLADVAAAPVIASSRHVADDLFARYGVEAIVGVNAPFTNLGAAAGYPTVTVPAGYAIDRPSGLSFFGPAWSEARLLSFAYDYEQATKLRVPPHVVNPALLDGVCEGGAWATAGAAASAAAWRH